MRFERRDMLEIMDEIDSRYVEEAGKAEKLERKQSKCSLIAGNVLKYALIAACLAAVIGAATMRVLKYQENNMQSGDSAIVPTDDELSEETALDIKDHAPKELDGEQIEESATAEAAEKTEMNLKETSVGVSVEMETSLEETSAGVSVEMETSLEETSAGVSAETETSLDETSVGEVKVTASASESLPEAEAVGVKESTVVTGVENEMD